MLTAEARWKNRTPEQRKDRVFHVQLMSEFAMDHTRPASVEFGKEVLTYLLGINSRAFTVIPSQITSILKKSHEHPLYMRNDELVGVIRERSHDFKRISEILAGINANLSHQKIVPPVTEEIPPETLRTIQSMIVNPKSLNLLWSQIIGSQEAKTKLQRTIELPILQSKFTSGVKKSRGILLYGPPGTGMSDCSNF